LETFSYHHIKPYYGSYSTVARLIPRVLKSSAKSSKITVIPEMAEKVRLAILDFKKGSNWPETRRKLEKNPKNDDFFFLVFW
jgi:hypothetical protein